METGGAKQLLKLYVLTEPGAEDARTAADRIYAIEGRKELAARTAAAKADAEKRRAREELAAKREEDEKYGWILGRWLVKRHWPSNPLTDISFATEITKSASLMSANQEWNDKDQPFLRGTAQSGGTIAWQQWRGEPHGLPGECPQDSGWQPIKLDIAPDKRTIRFLSPAWLLFHCRIVSYVTYTLTKE